jgi:prepilin-type N-terminal cleavage/methylation domain-containing protein
MQREGSLIVRGFTFIELVVAIVVLAILAAVAYPVYVNISKQAESAAAEGTIAAMRSALNINSIQKLVAGQAIAPHNPFDDLVRPPSNYAGAFGDVDLSNCPPGQWAFQSGNASNGNWAAVLYRPNATLTTAFAWGGAQWLVYEVKTDTNSAGQTIGLSLTEYPPQHKW